MSKPTNHAFSTSVGTVAKGNATLLLVLGVVGIISCCHLLGPVVWYMGKEELTGIAEGRITATNEGTAKAGLILGIITTALLVVDIVAFFALGGFALLGTVLGQ